MSGRSQSGSRFFLHVLIIFAISSFITVILYTGGFLYYCDNILYDRLINSRVSNRLDVNKSDIAVIDLTDVCIQELGSSLDTRRAFADLINILDNVYAYAVLDFMFPNPKDDDVLFAEALRQIRDSVVAVLAIEKDIMNQVNSPFKELNETEIIMLNKHIWHIKTINKGRVPQANTQK